MWKAPIGGAKSRGGRKITQLWLPSAVGRPLVGRGRTPKKRLGKGGSHYLSKRTKRAGGRDLTFSSEGGRKIAQTGPNRLRGANGGLSIGGASEWRRGKGKRGSGGGEGCDGLGHAGLASESEARRGRLRKKRFEGEKEGALRQKSTAKNKN